MSTGTPPDEPRDELNIYAPVDMNNFFAPASSPIVSIEAVTGDGVYVTLQSGLVLLYAGDGLSFTGTTPTGGTATSVSILDGNGEFVATLSMMTSQWNFSEITTDGPRQIYLSSPVGIFDTYGDVEVSGPSNIFGGNEADLLRLRPGAADTISGLGGDDRLVWRSEGAIIFPEGTVISGGAGTDTMDFSAPLVDLRNATIRRIEAINLPSDTATTVRISAAQLGNGQIASDVLITGDRLDTLMIDQVAGRAVDAARFQLDFAGPPTAPTVHVIGTAANDLQKGNETTNNLWVILEGFAGDDTLRGGGGDDSIFGGTGRDQLYGGTNDSSTGDMLYGGDGADRLIGGSSYFGSEEFLYGGRGNDTLIAGETRSVMEGGEGDDYLQATTPPFDDDPTVMDFLRGGEGNDTLVSGTGLAEMVGGEGNDLYRINSEVIMIEELADEGQDRVVTSVDLDLTQAGPDGDAGEIEYIMVKGGTGLSVTGTATGNRIDGNAGGDTLNGAGGDDQVNGRAGADVLSGGAGNDVLWGGTGADTFVFATGFGRDTVSDFTQGTDAIDLSALETVNSFDDLMDDHARQVGRNVWIEGDTGEALILYGASLSSLTADDFVF